MINWNELWKIRLNNYSDDFLTHEVIKLLLVKNILQKNHKYKKYQEIYTEYPVREGKVCDVFWRNLRTKEVIYFEIQKQNTPSWLKETQEAYKNIEGDLIIIPLKEMSDSLTRLNLQIKTYIP